MIDSSTKANGLPIGVELVDNKYYKASSTTNGVSVYLGLYKFIDDAFKVYRDYKVGYIRKLADYYLSLNALHKDIYDVLYKIDIIPYKGGRRENVSAIN